MKKKKQTYSIPLRLQKAAGIDCHEDNFQVALCKEGEEPVLMRFPAFTDDVDKLRDVLLSTDFKDVIIESTGVYWRYLQRVLTEGGIRVVVVNPFTVKQNPLEKTDKRDAVWLARILMNGMAKPSLMVSEQQEALREYTRQRLHYTQELTRVKNRIIRTLESCNYKIMSVISNISTKTGMKLVKKLSEGVTAPDELKACCHSSVLKNKAAVLPLALKGRLTINHQRNLQLLLSDWAYMEGQIEKVNAEIAKLFTDEQKAMIKKLDEVEGVAQESGEVIMAGMGINAKDFKGTDSASRYAGFAPGVHESSEKKIIVKCHPGNKYLRAIMLQVAWAAVKVKDGYWRAVYLSLKKSRGAKKAIVAVARRLVKVIYKILVQDHQYKKFTAKQYFENRAQVKAFKQSLKKVA
jgi:transposase